MTSNNTVITTETFENITTSDTNTTEAVNTTLSITPVGETTPTTIITTILGNLYYFVQSNFFCNAFKQSKIL